MAPFRAEWLTLLVSSFFISLLPGSALAQGATRGGVSIWGSGGLAAPSEGAFDSTFGVSGGIEYFLTPAVSVGATAGGWRSSTELGSHANEVYFDALAAYHWERGKLRPFVGGGLGIYREDFPARSKKTRLGGFAAAGLDFLLGGTWAAEGALRYHLTQSVQGLEGNFLEALLGVKFYF
jgi:Outer membrane protein beta-barrel domain